MKQQEQFRTYFNSAYQGEKNFVENIVRPVFGANNFTSHHELDILMDNVELQPLAARCGILKITAIGEIQLPLYSIQLFDIAVRDNMQLGRSRVNIQAVVRRIVNESYNGAFMIFHYKDDPSEWRFSFFDRGADHKELTSAKRYTYLLGEAQQCRTIAERFAKLTALKKIKREDVIEAFSVEALNKEFYSELFNWYQWVLSEEIMVTFPNNTTLMDDDCVRLEEQIIRLITRLLFVWFIKQKQLVPNTLFDENELGKILKKFQPHSTEDGNYYNAILQNLFFATLNKAVNERQFATLQGSRDIKTLYRYAEMFTLSESEVLKLFHPIPFLNGGLFECLDKEISTDGIKYHIDGFSRNSEKAPNGHFKHRAFIPNCAFFDAEKGIIPLLKKYNFTVEESSPNEQQVALDPELLGNVFENLLGVFNPETKESARKQSGSFYTPKEIVAYMVDESLIAYLMHQFDKHSVINEKVLRELFAKDTLVDPLNSNHPLCELIADRLRAIKILDPACGSGAFPMGILNRMVEILEKLDARDEKTIYQQKLHLIEECIYGVDIQTIASQISKLRFFISLIVEQDTFDLSNPSGNYGIDTLPNLETKFVTANTLISPKKNDQNQRNLFENPEIQRIKEELVTIRDEHFYAKNASTKKQLRNKDAKLRDRLVNLLEENGDFAPEDAIQYSQWNPYDQSACAPFFDPEWMFGITNGFDIVIGNPPYFSLSTDSSVKDNNDKPIKHNKIYEKCLFHTFERTGDIYCLFYERGWQLLKKHGLLCFITSNKWMRAGYGKSTRKFFANKTNPKILIDFGGTKVFESATVDTNILLFAKENNTFSTHACIVKNEKLKKLSDYVRQNSHFSEFSSSESWVILSPIERQIKEKIEKIGTPLKDWDIQINYGIKTGFNEAFIISGEKKAEILANCKTEEERQKTAEIIRPLLRGRDIKRYSYEFADKYLIATFPSRNYDIDKFPAVKTFLEGFKPKLKQTGEKLTNTEIEQVLQHAQKHGIKINESSLQKSRKKTTNKWFETQDSISYWEDFSKQKICWNRIASIKQFSLVNEDLLIQDSMHFFTGNHLLYLCAVLNSKLFRWLLSVIVGEAAGGNAGNSNNVSELNIAVPSKAVETQIGELMLKEKYKEIDSFVYHLYNLSDEEVKLIDVQ